MRVLSVPQLSNTSQHGTPIAVAPVLSLPPRHTTAPHGAAFCRVSACHSGHQRVLNIGNEAILHVVAGQAVPREKKGHEAGKQALPPQKIAMPLNAPPTHHPAAAAAPSACPKQAGAHHGGVDVLDANQLDVDVISCLPQKSSISCWVGLRFDSSWGGETAAKGLQGGTLSSKLTTPHLRIIQSASQLATCVSLMLPMPDPATRRRPAQQRWQRQCAGVSS